MSEERIGHLEFPGWVPRPVVEVARKMCAELDDDQQILTDEGKAEIQQMIKRIGNDWRMKSVFSYLTSLKVNDEVASCLWREAFSNVPEPLWPIREIALAGFFFRACQWAIFFSLFNPALIETLRQHTQLWEGVAAQCSSPGEQKIRGEKLSPLAVNLPTPAGRDGALLGLTGVPVPQRHRGNVRASARQYVYQLTNLTNLLYDGEPVQSPLATVTNVAFDLQGREQIKRDDVRNWVSRRVGN
jgi:hypothetical protein